ncbi:hypothetical protein C2G38_277664 [Gigaspora rosea]|uniref:F-box domain-containing protein n=1 Tax=Gigaspora rosea TaxID=44941 RepID=A0A397W227_9GLOM|nr:hypothetical protein C2G38_277664 [Gigaspora rosea]
MASKIFMGTMPEIMENILNNNLNNEFHTLHSCALVSRHWCKMSIPILWQDPFSFDRRKPLFISKYFSSLGEDEKFVLKKCGVNTDSETLFNYAKFLKVLDLFRLENKVKKWIDLELINSKLYCNSSMHYIINLLFKLFIESGATLYTLDLHFSEFLKFSPEIFYSLGENKQFFSQLQNLSLGIISRFNIESVATLLRVLAKNTTRIMNLNYFILYFILLYALLNHKINLENLV